MNAMAVGGSLSGATGYDVGTVDNKDAVASGLSETQLDAIQRKMAEWLESAKQRQPEGTPGVSDANGAPEIDGVCINF